MKKHILLLCLLFPPFSLPAQIRVLEVDVLMTDGADGYLGLPEVSTATLPGTTLARVKGLATPGDGGGGDYLWNGVLWEKVLVDDVLSSSVDQTFTAAQKAQLAENWPEAVADGGVSAINDLDDVDTATSPPATGQVLAWDAPSVSWLPRDVPDLSGALSLAQDQSLTFQQRDQLIFNWPDAVAHEEVITGAVADGQSNPLFNYYATLAEAQADFPAAEGLADEIDWAAIQSALDRLNTVAGAESGGTVFLPPGHYVLNKTLQIRGPGITMKGAGKLQTYLEYTPLTGTALRLSYTSDGDYATYGQSGSPRNVTLQDFKFVHGDPKNAANATTGFTTRTPLGGADFWYVLYLTLDRVDFEGFDIAAEFSNVPVCVLRDCSITGKSRSLRLYKIDSITAINCDLNGTYVPRNNVDNTQVDFDDNINIECISADAGDMTADGVFAAGGPNGAGFFMEIIGTELGHGKAVMINEGLPVSIRGCNIEDVTNPWAFKLSGPTRFTLENTRLELGSRVTDPGADPPANYGYSLFESIILVEVTNAPGLTPLLWLKNLILTGWDDGTSGLPHVVVRGNVADRLNVVVDQDRDYRVAYEAADGTFVYQIEKAGRIVDWYGPRTVRGDNDAGNAALLQSPQWIGVSDSYQEDLIAPYVDVNGTHRRSSLLNARLMDPLGDISANVSSTSGVDLLLQGYTVPEKKLKASGDKLEIFIAGSFAANATNKGLSLAFSYSALTEFARFESTAYSGADFVLEVTVQRRSTTGMLATSRLLVDGASPEIKVTEFAANLNADRELQLKATGGAGDVVLKQFDLTYEKGTSNL